MPRLSFLNSQSGQRRMSTDKGCAPGKSSLIGLGSARDYDGCAILQHLVAVVVLSSIFRVCTFNYKEELNYQV